jgi:hypothetical protein
MEASQGALGLGQRVVDLNEAGGQPILGELLAAEDSGEESPLVRVLFQLDPVGTLQWSLDEDHPGSSANAR